MQRILEFATAVLNWIADLISRRRSQNETPVSQNPDPAETPVPFAAIGPGGGGLHWPLVTTHPEAMTVSYRTGEGRLVGRDGRRFLASRDDGARLHVGIDLFGREGDEVVAVADGRIVDFYRFYTRPTTGEETFALIVEHAGIVCNYGEVKANSAAAFGWLVGDAVAAGRRIARVSGTAMLHFETYRSGTRRNVRWMRGDQPPEALLDPTMLLLRLAREGRRIGIGGAATGRRIAYDGPLPSTRSWHNAFGGRAWRCEARGLVTRAEGEGERLWRTPGEPVTCRAIFERFGHAIRSAAEKHGVNPALIIMTIATETGFARAAGFTGPVTFRWEGHVLNADVTPAFRGSYSAGPMQCLATTARELVAQFGDEFGLAYEPLLVAPALRRKPATAPERLPLYDPAIGIDIGTAAIRRRWTLTGDDPILVAAAFNSGGLHRSEASAWGLRAHGDHLDRAAAWYGDACAVLSEEGLL